VVLDFASSNPAEAVGFLLLKKSSACLPSEGKSNNLSYVPTLRHVKDPISCSSLRADSKIRVCSFLPSLIEASRAAWCGAPLEITEGTIWIWGTEGLSIRPRCSNPNDDSNSKLNIKGRKEEENNPELFIFLNYFCSFVRLGIMSRDG
jgi:hypothetical protein